jgi:hypothetical protein
LNLISETIARRAVNVLTMTGVTAKLLDQTTGAPEAYVALSATGLIISPEVHTAATLLLVARQLHCIYVFLPSFNGVAERKHFVCCQWS